MADPTAKPAGAGGLPDGAEMPARSPEEGARRLALHYLDQASAALPRIHDSADGEALHDLRVALRRLRSCLQTFAAQLGDSVPRKLMRRLRRIARATGPGRDAEVQLAWLRKHTHDLGRHQRSGQAWLAKRLEARMERAYGELRADLSTEFAPLEEALRRRLSVYRTEVRLDGGRAAAFGDVAAELLDDHAGELDRLLRKVDDPAGIAAAHEARIAAKRLRYLADPLSQMAPTVQPPATAHLDQRRDRAAGSPNGALTRRGRHQAAPWNPLLANLKELQDLLGELHDSHVLEAELTEAVAGAAAERASRLIELTLDAGETGEARLRAERRRPHEPGLLALARLNRARRDHLFADLAAGWPQERRAQLLQSVEALARALRAAGHPEEAAPAGDAPTIAPTGDAPTAAPAGDAPTAAPARGTAPDG
jgi:CHAD domain-containing protein